LETRIDLLVYVSKKYPNLTEFIFKNDNSRLDTSDIENLLKYAWTPFSKNLGPQLNKLCLDNRAQMNNLFETIDGFGCKIEHLEITNLAYSALAKIAESHQVHYIQKLTLKDTKFQSFHWLKNLRVLKHLKITHARYGISCPVNMNLGDVLDNAPSTLESLYFRRVTLTLPPGYTGLSGIKSLDFCNVDLPKGVGGFLSKYFPKLSRLALKRCGMPEKTLRLPTANLARFAYFADSSNKEENVLVVTAGNNERCMYTAHTDMRKLSTIPYRSFYDEIYSSSKCRLADESDTSPWFTLYCNLLYTISFIE
jgi:hypothetical protein